MLPLGGRRDYSLCVFHVGSWLKLKISDFIDMKQIKSRAVLFTIKVRKLGVRLFSIIYLLPLLYIIYNNTYNNI